MPGRRGRVPSHHSLALVGREQLVGTSARETGDLDASFGAQGAAQTRRIVGSQAGLKRPSPCLGSRHSAS